MPRQAIDMFTRTIDRSLELGLLPGKITKDEHIITKIEPTPTLLDDLLRATIVWSVAAMDAYFTDKFAEMLLPYLRKKKPDMAQCPDPRFSLPNAPHRIQSL